MYIYIHIYVVFVLGTSIYHMFVIRFFFFLERETRKQKSVIGFFAPLGAKKAIRVCSLRAFLWGLL